MFRESAKNLHRVRALTCAGVLIAAQIVLAQMTIVFSEAIHLSVDRCALALNAAMLGPTVGAVSGVIADLLQCMFHGWTPNPGLSLCEALTGIVFGVFLWHGRPASAGESLPRRARAFRQVLRVVLAQAVVSIVFNMLLNTLWLCLWYGWSYPATLGPRVIKNLAQYPVDVLLISGLLILRDRLYTAGVLRPFPTADLRV